MSLVAGFCLSLVKVAHGPRHLGRLKKPNENR